MYMFVAGHYDLTIFINQDYCWTLWVKPKAELPCQRTIQSFSITIDFSNYADIYQNGGESAKHHYKEGFEP